MQKTERKCSVRGKAGKVENRPKGRLAGTLCAKEKKSVLAQNRLLPRGNAQNGVFFPGGLFAALAARNAEGEGT